MKMMNRKSLRFKKKIINTENSKLHNTVMRTMRDTVMLLPLHTPLRDAVTFCTFEKIRELMTAKKRWQKQLVYKKQLV
jgi:hypothetical protein